MCGIIGVYGDNAISNVFSGLKSLEYRGYDSWGIAFPAANSIAVEKDVGQIGKVNEILNPDSDMAIGHTRWATHGNVSKINAHPHLSNNRKIAVVHNGIVENHDNLKQKLEDEGFAFESSTDTEIIPNLIEFYMRKDLGFQEAFRRTLLDIKGSYAIVAFLDGFKGIYGARNGSPLVLGVGDKSFFLASDVPAFLERTNQVVYLDDGEMVVGDGGYKIFDTQKNFSEGQVQKRVDKINWSVEASRKGSFEHFMLKEIFEQKETILKAVIQGDEKISKATEMIKSAKGVFFVGCGTSYHACVSSSYAFSHLARMHVNVCLASEFSNYKSFINENTLVVAVSQSGETADLIEAVKAAQKKKAKVISVVNVMGSTLMRLSDESILMNSGPEICVLSTKSYTAQLAILLLLAYSVSGKLGEGKVAVERAAKEIPLIIDANVDSMKGLAKRLKDSKDFFILGRDLAFPSALEAALKIKEVSYIHAEGFAGGELKHGTIALIEEGVPVVVFVTDSTRDLILGNAQEVKSRGAFLIGVDSRENKLFDYLVKVPSLGFADPISMIIPMQILAYYLALEKGLDPDKPRNLAKSVTVK